MTPRHPIETAKSWSYLEPNDPATGDWEARVITMTEQEILDEYYPYWQERMWKVGKADLISPQNCIEDWVVVHWASPDPLVKEPR